MLAVGDSGASSVSWPSPNRPFKACSAGLTVEYSIIYMSFAY